MIYYINISALHKYTNTYFLFNVILPQAIKEEKCADLFIHAYRGQHEITKL